MRQYLLLVKVRVLDWFDGEGVYGAVVQCLGCVQSTFVEQVWSYEDNSGSVEYAAELDCTCVRPPKKKARQ